MEYLPLKSSLKLVFVICIASFLIFPKTTLAQSNGDVDIQFRGRDTMVNGVNMKYLPAKDQKAVRAQIAMLNRLSTSAQAKTSVPKTTTPNTDSVSHSVASNKSTVGATPAQTSLSTSSNAAVPLTTTPTVAAAAVPIVTPPVVPTVAPTVAPSVTPSVVVPAPSVASSAAIPVVVPIVAPTVGASASPAPQNAATQSAVTPTTPVVAPVVATPAPAPALARELVPNTQTFNYSITSKEGINTHLTYYVSEPVKSEAQQIIGAYKPGLEIQDVSLVPQFWAGKTLLTFSLPDKTPATVEITDNEGKLLWEDKITSPSFSKSFSWTLNGTYYLVVRQGGETAIKKVIKE